MYFAHNVRIVKSLPSITPSCVYYVYSIYLAAITFFHTFAAEILKPKGMKRKFIFIACMLIASLHCSAEHGEYSNIYERIIFQIECNFNRKGSANVPKPKAPARIPNVYIDNHTLYFESDMTGYGIELLAAEDEETVIYEDIITAGSQTYALPESLSGEYIIRLTYGNLCFIGSIGL